MTTETTILESWTSEQFLWERKVNDIY